MTVKRNISRSQFWNSFSIFVFSYFHITNSQQVLSLWCQKLQLIFCFYLQHYRIFILMKIISDLKSESSVISSREILWFFIMNWKNYWCLIPSVNHLAAKVLRQWWCINLKLIIFVNFQIILHVYDLLRLDSELCLCVHLRWVLLLRIKISCGLIAWLFLELVNLASVFIPLTDYTSVL